MSRYDSTRHRPLRLRLLAAYPWCSYCGRRLDERSCSLDHVVPRSRGGRTTEDNVTLVCKTCNTRKGSWTSADWMEWIRAVVKAERRAMEAAEA